MTIANDLSHAAIARVKAIAWVSIEKVGVSMHTGTWRQALTIFNVQVHVSLVPLVSEDTEIVQRPYNWGGHAHGGQEGSGGVKTDDVGSIHTPGSFLTPSKYEAGEGEVATCTSSPMVTNDVYASMLPQVIAREQMNWVEGGWFWTKPK